MSIYQNNILCKISVSLYKLKLNFIPFTVEYRDQVLLATVPIYISFFTNVTLFAQNKQSQFSYMIIGLLVIIIAIIIIIIIINHE